MHRLLMSRHIALPPSERACLSTSLVCLLVLVCSTEAVCLFFWAVRMLSRCPATCNPSTSVSKWGAYLFGPYFAFLSVPLLRRSSFAQRPSAPEMSLSFSLPHRTAVVWVPSHVMPPKRHLVQPGLRGAAAAALIARLRAPQRHAWVARTVKSPTVWLWRGVPASSSKVLALASMWDHGGTHEPQ